METGLVHMAPEPLMGLADLLIREGEHQRAVELLALILRHPASPQVVRDRAEDLLADVASDLPSEVVAAATARGEARELDHAVAEILESNARRGSYYAY